MFSKETHQAGVSLPRRKKEKHSLDKTKPTTKQNI